MHTPLAKLELQKVDEELRKLRVEIDRLRGRNGQIQLLNNISVKAPGQTLMEFDSQTAGKASIVAYGTENGTIALAKGAYKDNNGDWIATDTSAVIWALSRAGAGTLYVNSGLTVGQAFLPTVSASIGSGGAIPASAIVNTPAGSISATNVQAALNELDGEKLSLENGGTVLGTLSYPFRGASVYNNADISVTAGSATLFTANTENYDTSTYHSTSNNTSRLVVPSGLEGYYQVLGRVRWDATSTANSYRTIALEKNSAGSSSTGAIFAQVRIMANPDSTVFEHECSGVIYLSVNDYIEMFVIAGENTNIKAVTSTYYPWTSLSLYRLGT